MPRLPIGVQLKSLRLPFKQALSVAARLGASAVEIDARGDLKPGELSQTALRQVRKMLDDLRLSVSAVGFATRRGYDSPDDLEGRLAATKAAMLFAYRLGAPVVINQVGRVPPAADDGAYTGSPLLVDALSDLGVYGQHAGALLAADTGSESGPDLASLLRMLPGGAIGVNLSPGNLLVNGFSPLEAVEALGDAILHVHANDGVRDIARGRGVETPLGRGAADYPALLGALAERGYRGYFTVERRAAGEPVAEISRGIEYLRSLE